MREHEQDQHHWVRDGDPWDYEPDPESPDTLRALEGYVTDALAHQQYGGNKASPLITAITAVIATAFAGRPEALDSLAHIVQAAAFIGVVTTISLTLWALRPSLSGDVGVVRWATLSVDQIVSEAASLAVNPGRAARRMAADTQVHARIAVRRYRQIRLSTYVSLATLFLAVIARALLMT